MAAIRRRVFSRCFVVIWGARGGQDREKGRAHLGVFDVGGNERTAYQGLRMFLAKIKGVGERRDEQHIA